MLGTGNAMVTRCYNTCFVLSSGEEYFLVDAGGGNGIFKQLEQAGVPFTGIREMFVTHAHTDHILGAIWVIRKIATLMSNDKYRRNPGTANLFFRYSFYQDEAVRIPGFVTRWTGAGLSGRRTL